MQSVKNGFALMLERKRVKFKESLCGHLELKTVQFVEYITLFRYGIKIPLNTVNSEIFATVLFLLQFAVSIHKVS